jgi:DNA polymerase delta subunit 4
VVKIQSDVSSKRTTMVEISDDEGDEAKMDEDEEALRVFDLTTKFGPCLGLSRLERYDRALKYGLHPPKKVLEVIHRRGGVDGDARWTQSVWFGRV